MNKFNKIVITYFLGVLPVLLLMMTLDGSESLYQKSLTDQFYGFLNSAVGLVFGLWMLSALYVSASLVLSSRFRELVILRLVKIQERDERESLIVGQASKKIFLLSLAVLSLLFVLSTIQIHLQEKVVGDKNHALSLGLKFSLWAESGQSNAGEVLNYGFPFSVQGVLILMLVWQVLSFYYYNRTLSKIT